MTSNLFSVADKRVVVTGGSRGIGLMIARGFVEAGAHVLICARKQDELRAAADELGALGDCDAVVADLSTLAGVQELAGAVRAWSPRVDVLVNNAGAAWGAPLEDYPESGFDKVMAVNVKGLFYLTTELLPQLRAAASPEAPARVINIGSVDGLVTPATDNYAYAASKAAVHMLTRHLARQLAPDHITANAIAPGPFPSRMTRYKHDDPAQRAELVAGVPMGRVGVPADIAGTAIYLASEAGAYVTAAIVPVDGGWSGIR